MIREHIKMKRAQILINLYFLQIFGEIYKITGTRVLFHDIKFHEFKRLYSCMHAR